MGLRILVTAPYSEDGLDKLREYGDVFYQCWKENGEAHSPEQVIQLLEKYDANALIIEHDKIDKTVLDSRLLSFIGVCRGTPSNVDVAYASEKHIPIFHTPARNAQAVAEMVVASIVFFYRKVFRANTWLKEGDWDGGAHDSYLQFKGNELAGKTVGMVGFGAVGQTIAKLLHAYPCRVQYYDPFLPESPNEEYTSVSLEAIFETSDIVSIHLPENEKTKDMINADLIDRMKKDAIFINSARASVVNRDALYRALKEKRIRGAILDVFHHEPPDDIDMEIIRMDNVLATPHIAGATYEVEKHHEEIMNDALSKYFADPQKHIKQLINPKAV
jgi:D-3-phosphoglycerate dehydrogenase